MFERGKRAHSYMLVGQWRIGLVKWWEEALSEAQKAWLTHFLRGIVSEQKSVVRYFQHSPPGKPKKGFVSRLEKNIARNHSYSLSEEARTGIVSRLEKK